MIVCRSSSVLFEVASSKHSKYLALSDFVWHFQEIKISISDISLKTITHTVSPA